MTEIRPLDLSPEGIRRTAELLRVVFPHARHLTPEYLTRLYTGNPLGETFGLAAWEGDVLVGHYLMIPVRTRIFGEVEDGIWPFQLATHPAYRLKGVFSTFVERSMEIARERGYGHLVGVGNANSTPIFVRKWDFQAIRQLDVRLGLGPAPPPGDDSELDLVRVWDAPGVAWRLRHPPEPYRLLRRDGLARLYAPATRARIPVEIAALPEALLPDETHVRPLRTPHPLRLYVGADPTRDWRGARYRDVPRRFWPSPLHLLFKDLTGRNRRFEPHRVRYSVFDFDAW